LRPTLRAPPQRPAAERGLPPATPRFAHAAADVAATIDSIRKSVQDRGEIVILYFNFDRYSKIEEVYGWEKLDSVLETTARRCENI